MRVLKIALLACVAVVGSAVAAHAQITVTAEVTPAPRPVTGITGSNVVPISGAGTADPTHGVANFDLTFSEAVEVIVQVKKDTYLTFSNNTTISTSATSLSFSLSQPSSQLSDQENEVRFFARAATSGSTFTGVGDVYTVYVDRVAPSAPGDIQAEGADEIILVEWDAPTKPSGFEQFDGYIITYSETDFSASTTAEAENLPTTTADAVGANEATIEDVENGTTYYISVRTVDWVGNTSAFPKNESGGILTVSAQPVITLSLAELAGEQGGCFIATAAYGSYQEPHVQVLRQFRDRVLLRSEAGQRFVDWYYRASPAYAMWIAKHDAARTAVRMFLLPLYAFAYMMLHPLWALLAGILLIGIGAARYALPREVAR